MAARAGRIVGLIEWEIGPEGDRAVGEVQAIHVAAGERGRGVGKVLPIAAVEAMRSLGVRRAVLRALDGNANSARLRLVPSDPPAMTRKTAVVLRIPATW